MNMEIKVTKQITTALYHTKDVWYDPSVAQHTLHYNQHYTFHFISLNRHGGASVSALECDSMQVMLKTWVRTPRKRAFQLKSLRHRLATKRYFTHSVVCVVVECTIGDNVRVTKTFRSCRPALLETDRVVSLAATILHFNKYCYRERVGTSRLWYTIHWRVKDQYIHILSANIPFVLNTYIKSFIYIYTILQGSDWISFL